MNTKTLEELVAVLGPDVLPTRAVRAMRSGEATPEGVGIVLRAKHLPRWREICDRWMKGTLFAPQRMGWEQWSTGYTEAEQRFDRLTYDNAWNAAFCCGEDKTKGWESIHAFYISRVDDRFQMVPRSVFHSLKPEQLDKVRKLFFKQDADNGWGWGR